jgi:hypothetical protein
MRFMRWAGAITAGIHRQFYATFVPNFTSKLGFLQSARRGYRREFAISGMAVV